MNDGRDDVDPSCFEFAPVPFDGMRALLGATARPDLSPIKCWEHWATLPRVDCTDAALARYRAWTRSLMATTRVVRP